MNASDTQSKEVFEQIASLLRQKAHVRLEINGETEILKDLGLWGDDLDEFFAAYSKQFGVDMKDVKFTDYFPQEGEHVGLALRSFFTGRAKHQWYRPIKISDLVESALAQKWECHSSSER